MKLSLGSAIAAFAASSMLLGLVCAHAQEADESEMDAAKTPPQITQVAGTWTGTDTQQGSDPGPMTLDLTQNQKKIGGTFSVTAGPDQTPAGSLTGKITNDTLTLTFHTTSGVTHKCNAAVVATVDDDTMSGTFLVTGNKQHCQGKGTFDLEKQ